MKKHIPAAACAAGAACAALTGFVYLAAFASPRFARTPDKAMPRGAQYEAVRAVTGPLIEAMAGEKCEEVYITSFDGLRLRGRYYHLRDGAPVQIQLHGYRGAAVRDFCGGFRLARELGQNVLAVDERAQGRSGGLTITFGAKEKYDCLSWIDYVNQRFGDATPIYLAGVSMGAAAVLMAAGLELTANVRAVIADSPYTSAREIIGKVIREDLHLPARALMPFVELAARVFGRFSLAGADALGAVRAARVPVLLIHGEDDRFVPCGMSRELYAACGGAKRLFTVPGAGHGLSYIADPEGYALAVRDFCAAAGA